jgi:hypothetical protein
MADKRQLNMLLPAHLVERVRAASEILDVRPSDIGEAAIERELDRLMDSKEWQKKLQAWEKEREERLRAFREEQDALLHAARPPRKRTAAKKPTGRRS